MPDLMDTSDLSDPLLQRRLLLNQALQAERLKRQRLDPATGFTRYAQTPDQSGTAMSLAQQSLLRSGAQPGAWQAMSPAARQRYVAARQSQMQPQMQPSMASVPTQAAAAVPALVGTVTGTGASRRANGEKYAIDPEMRDEPESQNIINERLSQMRQDFNDQAHGNRARIMRENGGRMPTANEKISAQNKARFDRRMEAIAKRQLATNAAQLTAIALQRKQTGADRLHNAQATAIEQALGGAQGPAAQTPQVPQGPVTPDNPQAHPGVTMRKMTPWERWMELWQGTDGGGMPSGIGPGEMNLLH